jgi:hypothetical protein
MVNAFDATLGGFTDAFVSKIGPGGYEDDETHEPPVARHSLFVPFLTTSE